MSSVLWYTGQQLLVPDAVAASGCEVIDASGRRWVDLESGVWCASIGHSHPRVAATIAEQAGRLAHAGYNYGSALVEDAARAVLAVAGLAGGACAFLCSGSEAVEYVVQAARPRMSRPLLLVMSDAYFGAYGAARRRDPAEWHVFDVAGCAGCREPACTERCRRFSELPFDRIGGFLLEPGSASGVVRFPPRALVGAIASALAASGGLLLVNEVTTGIGRTGAWFGYQHYGLAPDAVAIGKGIGNGYPVSVAAFGPRLAASLAEAPLRYAQSHQNDPLGAAVAREVIRTIEAEGLVERGRRAGERLLEALVAVAARRASVREVRGRGLMIAIELADDPERTRARAAHLALARRGFLVGRRTDAPVLRVDPSLTVPQGVLDAFVAALDEVLGELERA